MKRTGHLAVMAAGLALAATQASATTLTFEDLVEGVVLSNQYAALGAVFSANAFSGPGSSSTGEDWATNSDMTIVSSEGEDVGGLGTPAGLVSGNILRSFDGWLGENGDPSFLITFSGPATGFSASFAGVFEPEDVTIFGYNGATLLGTVSGTVTTGQFTLSFPGTVTSVAIRPGTYTDWVGVDNITYNLAAVPEPGTYAMMGLGVAALLAYRRRKTV
jgi:PEP-CTERM motif